MAGINLKDVREALATIRNGVNCDIEDFDSMERLFCAHDYLADIAPDMAEALVRMESLPEVVNNLIAFARLFNDDAPQVAAKEAYSALAAFLKCVEGRE